MDNGEPVIHRAALCPQAPQPSISFDKKTSKSKPIIGRLIYKEGSSILIALETWVISAVEATEVTRSPLLHRNFLRHRLQDRDEPPGHGGKVAVFSVHHGDGTYPFHVRDGDDLQAEIARVLLHGPP